MSLRTGILNVAAASFHLATKEAVKFFSTVSLMIRDPGEFARINIGGKTARRTVQAIQFFLAVFVFSFALKLFAAQFQFYDGASEIRETVKILLQMALGVPLLYALLVLFRYRVTLASVLQTALYVDAVYLLVLSVAAMPLQYADYALNFVPAEQIVDIFSTELERCTAQSSLIYWLVRGDLQFYLYGDQWKSTGTLGYAINNLHYLIAPPFVLLFAAILRAKFGGRLVVAATLAGLCVVAAFVSFERAERWIADSRQEAAPECITKAIVSIMRRYSTDLIARQVEYKINNDLTKSAGNEKKLLYYERTQFSWRGSMKRGVIDSMFKSGAELPGAMRRMYCSINWYWVVMRSTNLPFDVKIVVEESNEVAFSGRYLPEDCPDAE